MNRVEQPIHIAIADFLRVALPPEWEWQTVDNSKRRKPAEQKAMKRMGNAPGWPDIQIVPPHEWGPLLTIEVKAPGKYPSKEQLGRHHKLMDLGHKVGIARSPEDAERFLRAEDVPLRATTGAMK